MNNQEFLHVGTKNITNDLTNAIYDGNPEREGNEKLKLDDLKPYSGFWLSAYTSNTSNPWIDKLLINSPTFNIRRNNQNILDASIVKIKADDNIFVIDSLEKIKYLIEKYPSDIYNDFFSYEKLSQDYDGLYIKDDNNKIIKDIDGNIIGIDLFSKLLNQLGFNTLILFNLKPIDYYHEAEVIIDKDNKYTINVNNEKKEVNNIDESLIELKDLVLSHLEQEILEFNNIRNSILNKVKTTIDSILDENTRLDWALNDISSYLRLLQKAGNKKFNEDINNKLIALEEEIKEEITMLFTKYYINIPEDNYSFYTKLLFPQNDLLLGTIKKIVKETFNKEIDAKDLEQIFKLIHISEIESDRKR